MLGPGWSLVLAFCAVSLFPSSLGLSSRPAWATLMWDVPSHDLEQQDTGTGSQCSYQPCPAEELQPSSAQLGITLVSLEVACLSCSALCLLLSRVLLVRCIYRKAKRHLREEMGQTPSGSPGTCCQGDCSCKNYDLICQLKKNPDLMKRYLRHLHHCYLQEDILQRQEEKKVSEDLEEETTHFST